MKNGQKSGRALSIWVCLLFATLAVAAMPSPAQAAACNVGAKWAGGAFTYKINLTSFSTLGNIVWARPGFVLSDSSAYVWWVNYGLANWRERTGANGQVNFTYAGTTTYSCGGTGNGDGQSTIAVIPGCADGGANCSVVGLTIPNCNAAGTLFTEVDVCIFGGSVSGQGLAGFSVESNLVQGSVSLVTTLAHELGHALGVWQHNDSISVMTAGLESSSNIDRYPYGDDITRLQAGTSTGTCDGGQTCTGPAYGTSAQHIYWKEYGDGVGWGTENMLPSNFTTWYSINVAIGKTGTNTGKVVVGELGTNQIPYFLTTDYPIRSSSTWLNWHSAGDLSWRPPVVAARSYGTPLWVGAFSWPQSSYNAANCPGIGVRTSSDAFANSSLVTVGGQGDSTRICTIHQPGLVFDEKSGRFVLAYVAQSKLWDTPNNLPFDSRLHVRTSTNGSSWTADQDLGAFTIDAPSLACKPFAPGAEHNCLMAYPRGEWFYAGSNPTYYPEIIARSFLVNSSTGAFTFGATTSYPDWVQRSVPVASAPFWGDRFWLGEHWSASQSDWANGMGGFWTIKDDTTPPDVWNWEIINANSGHALSVAAAPGGERVYAFYVKP